VLNHYKSNEMLKIISLFVLLSLLAGCVSKKEEKSDCCTQKKDTKIQTKNDIPGLSVYQIDMVWNTQDNHEIRLSSLAGKPVLMTMIYTHCGYACPMMVSDLKKIEALFTEAEREKFHIVLVSFDPDRDQPARLKTYAETQQLGANWTLLQGSHDQTKALSVVLQISYELLPDSSIDHANSKVVLNRQGEIVYRLNGLSTDPAAVATALRQEMGD